MKSLRNRARWWIAGVTTAFFGVALVRVAAPRLDGADRLLVAGGGQCLALGGLLILCLGVSRRISQSSDR